MKGSFINFFDWGKTWGEKGDRFKSTKIFYPKGMRGKGFYRGLKPAGTGTYTLQGDKKPLLFLKNPNPKGEAKKKKKAI